MNEDGHCKEIRRNWNLYGTGWERNLSLLQFKLHNPYGYSDFFNMKGFFFN